MRLIVLDTETTGLNAKLGDRIIEVGCVEILNRRLTENRFHRYINPERDSEEGALKVHGITGEFLQETDFLDYIRGAELVIHNAAFDVEFLNRELDLAGLPSIDEHCEGIVDTLRLAKDLHPGKRNSLDALCERYQIDNSRRTLHGALLDAELLAEVYLAMTRGQDSLAIDLDLMPEPAGQVSAEAAERPRLLVVAPSAAELAEHERVLAGIDRDSKGRCVWLRCEDTVS
jgi:DNA polymerase-3 subunit epsilon